MSMRLAPCLLAACSGLLLLAGPAPSVAAPPGNDHVAAPAAFEPYTAANGRPSEQQAVAELREATPDAGIVRCLGARSFARTVWYHVPEAAGPQQITVEASGRTLDVVDLAAFVQPEVAAPPPPPPPPPPPSDEPDPDPDPAPPARRSQASNTLEPNACAGRGTGGAEDAEEPTSAVSLVVPPRHPVLIQVGRRGPLSSYEDELAVLSLEQLALETAARPPGDRADAAPAARRTSGVVLDGATTTEEDPAQPACPALASVWRKFTPGAKGRRWIRASGPGVETLAVFSGRRPTGDNALDCVNRETRGALEMVVPVKRRRPVWIRIGTDRPLPGSTATLRVRSGARVTVIDGGRGGSDPTPGGPGGGFPAACDRARTERARVSGARLRGPAGAYNRYKRVPLAIRVTGASICDVELRLLGPRGHVYAKGRAIRLRRRSTVRLPRMRTFRRGRYRLKVTAVSPYGRRVAVRTRVTGRLR